MLLCSTYLQTTAVMVIRLTLPLPFQNTYYLIIFVLHFSAVVPHIASIFLEYITVEEATLLMNSVVWKSHKLVCEAVTKEDGQIFQLLLAIMPRTLRVLCQVFILPKIKTEQSQNVYIRCLFSLTLFIF